MLGRVPATICRGVEQVTGRSPEGEAHRIMVRQCTGGTVRFEARIRVDEAAALGLSVACLGGKATLRASPPCYFALPVDGDGDGRGPELVAFLSFLFLLCFFDLSFDLGDLSPMEVLLVERDEMLLPHLRPRNRSGVHRA